LQDSGNPQQLNGYAYANNNPLTFSDPDGQMLAADASAQDFKAVAAAHAGATLRLRPYGPSRVVAPITDQQWAQTQVNAAVAQRDYHRKQFTNKVKEVGEIIAGQLAITDALGCLTKGNVGQCVNTAANVLAAAVGGLVGKILKKYGAPWRWAKGAKLVKLLGDLVDDAWMEFRAEGHLEGDIRAAKAALTDARELAASKARGLSDLGGVMSQSGTNAAGGRIFTSSGTIAQKDLAGIVNNG
jgi:hypothetical protein